MEMPSRSFASDNNSGIHPKILEAISRANSGHCVAYGADPYTEKAIAQFKEIFGRETEAFFVFNGTGANVLSISALLRPYQAVVCAESAHLHRDECGAPEKFSGAKLLLAPSPDGKVTIEGVRSHLVGIGDPHHVQPRVLSLTQATEYGTIYSRDQLRELCDFAHSQGLLVHVDGARIANAAAAQSLGLKEATKDVGVDVLSFGGTKNGLMGGEAVLFFRKELAENFEYIRKQGAQLSSKMRFISAQFSELLTDELWRKNANHSNQMAQLLASEIRDCPAVKIVQNVQTNAVFAQLAPAHIARLKERFFFYTWDERASIVRWMTSFDTTEDDIRSFARAIRELA